MRFHLQDVKKSIQRRGGELFVALHFLRPRELQNEISQLIAYHERLLGQPQRRFALDEARACVGEYRQAHCLIATLSHWYQWQPRDWLEALQALHIDRSQALFASATQLRLALYTYVNEHYQGFLDAAQRTQALGAFAESCQLALADLEYLLMLDSEEEELLTRETLPTPQDVTALYNQWVFEAALLQASSVHFIIDCAAFNRVSASLDPQSPIHTGVGTAIKRLCYLARKLGVYYDLAYEAGDELLLTLTLYGPQEVTGAPQQYGLRLARLCRMLLDYARPGVGRGATKKAHRGALTSALVKAEATVHFLQRSYTFVLGAELLRLVFAPSQEDTSVNASAPTLFDSGIEESFADAFEALARSHGVDGWQLEREPEPLLLEHSIFIPDFACTRARRRIYVEILGFWTPSYRERKIQKLQQLRGRDDLLLAIPLTSREAFAVIAADFPIVYYDGQLSVTELLHVLRTRYDDLSERLVQIDVSAVRAHVRQTGIIVERACYTLLHSYRRSELQQAVMRVVTEDVHFVSGIGLYTLRWMEQLRDAWMAWVGGRSTLPLAEALQAIREIRPELRESEDALLEALLGLWSEVHIRRDSIFEGVVEIVNQVGLSEEAYVPETIVKRSVRERRAPTKKRPRGAEEHKTTQSDLWGLDV